MPSSSLTMARLKAQVVEERRGLELYADARLDGRGIGPHGQAVDDDRAAVGCERPSTISRVVVLPAPWERGCRPLAAPRLEGDAVDGDELTVTLGELADGDDGVAGGVGRRRSERCAHPPTGPAM
jgi:hypothetical protein